MNESDTPRTQAIRDDLMGISSEGKIWNLFKKLEDMERELTAVTEQRDRLVDAMRQMWPFIEEDDYPNCNTPEFNTAILKYKQALQSLTTNDKDSLFEL
jgi:hypothetical protein